MNLARLDKALNKRTAVTLIAGIPELLNPVEHLFTNNVQASFTLQKACRPCKISSIST